MYIYKHTYKPKERTIGKKLIALLLDWTQREINKPGGNPLIQAKFREVKILKYCENTQIQTIIYSEELGINYINKQYIERLNCTVIFLS